MEEVVVLVPSTGDDGPPYGKLVVLEDVLELEVVSLELVSHGNLDVPDGPPGPPGPLGPPGPREVEELPSPEVLIDVGFTPLAPLFQVPQFVGSAGLLLVLVVVLVLLLVLVLVVVLLLRELLDPQLYQPEFCGSEPLSCGIPHE